MINTSATGRLTKCEVSDYFQSRNINNLSDFDFDKMFEAADTDRSGYIDITEFYAATFLPRHMISKKRLRKAFNTIDFDRRGGITRDEVRVCLLDGTHVHDSNWR